MSIRKGVCTNIDGCSLAEKDQVQEIDSSDEFICKECHHELQEIKPKGASKGGKNNNPLFLIIGGVAVVAIAVGCYFAFSGPKEAVETEVVTTDSITAVVEEAEVVATDTVVAETGAAVLEIQEPTMVEDGNPGDEVAVKGKNLSKECKLVMPSQAEMAYSLQGDTLLTFTLTKNAEDGVYKLVSENGQTVPAAIVKMHVAEEPKAEKTQPAQTKSNSSASGTHNLGYATWTGSMRSGKPHGNGTMTYSASHRIDPRDSKARTAQKGEYVIGEWSNGNLVQGRWFKDDGSKEVIIIGKAG